MELVLFLGIGITVLAVLTAVVVMRERRQRGLPPSVHDTTPGDAQNTAALAAALTAAATKKSGAGF